MIRNQLARATKNLKLGTSGLQLPSGSFASDFVHSITYPGSPVNGQESLGQALREFVGNGPQKPWVFEIFGLWSGYEAVAALKRRGGCVVATFGVVRRGWRDSLYLGLVSAEAKAAYLVHLWYVVSAGPSKTSFACGARAFNLRQERCVCARQFLRMVGTGTDFAFY